MSVAVILLELNALHLHVSRCNTYMQGWQSTGQYAYWPDQWSLLVLTGHNWWIGGQLVDWKNLVDVKILGIIYPAFYWTL